MISDFSHLSPDEIDILLLNTLVELLITFAETAHVNIHLINISIGFFLKQVGILKSIHTANARAILMIVLVPAANAVDNRNALRLPTIGKDYVSLGGASGATQPFKLKASEHIGIVPVAILGNTGGVKGIKSCG